MKANLILLWTARISSVVSFLIISFIFIGEGFNPTAIEGNELVLFIFFPILVIIGFVISWKKELIGSIISMLGLVVFYLIHYFSSGSFPRGSAFLIFTIPAFLFWLHYIFLIILLKRKTE